MNTKGCSFGTSRTNLNRYNLISCFALQVGCMSKQVLKAQKLGYGPGKYSDPWDPRFQYLAAKLYATTFTPAYCRGLADSCLQVAKVMENTACSDDIDFAWGVLRIYLRSAAQSILADPEVKTIDRAANGIQIMSTLPGHLHHEVFAALLSKQGAKRLYDAASSVMQFCNNQLPSAPSGSELEWVVAVAKDEPIQLLAQQYNLPLRSAYRRLQDLWAHFEVKNAVQGVALAVQRRWIAPPPKAYVCSPTTDNVEWIPTKRSWQAQKGIPSEEQLMCLQGLALGESHQEIAHNLSYSTRQLERMLNKMRGKLEVATSTEALALAVNEGWVTVQH